MSESRKGNYGVAIKAFFISRNKGARKIWEDVTQKQAKGGRQTRASTKAIETLVSSLIDESQRLTASDAWELISNDDFHPTHASDDKGFEYNIWREEDTTDIPLNSQKLFVQRVENGTPTGLIKSITYNAFRRYITDARKEMRNK